MEEDNAPILAAPHFYWGACLVCNMTAAKGKPLKRCSRCHSVYYCSADHQRLNWKQHKQLCTHLSKAAEAAELETFFCGAAGSSSSDWNKFRGNAVRTAEIILARPLELIEQVTVSPAPAPPAPVAGGAPVPPHLPAGLLPPGGGAAAGLHRLSRRHLLQ